MDYPAPLTLTANAWDWPKSVPTFVNWLRWWSHPHGLIHYWVSVRLYAGMLRCQLLSVLMLVLLGFWQFPHPKYWSHLRGLSGCSVSGGEFGLLGEIFVRWQVLQVPSVCRLEQSQHIDFFFFLTPTFPACQVLASCLNQCKPVPTFFFSARERAP